MKVAALLVLALAATASAQVTLTPATGGSTYVTTATTADVTTAQALSTNVAEIKSLIATGAFANAKTKYESTGNVKSVVTGLAASTEPTNVAFRSVYGGAGLDGAITDYFNEAVVSWVTKP